MSLIHFEHFETYGTNINNLALRQGHQLVGTALGIAATGGRTGNACLNVTTSNNGGAVLINFTDRAVVGIGGAWRLTGTTGFTAPDQINGLHLRSGSTLVRALFSNDNRIQLYVGNTLVAQSAASVFALNTYFWLEFKAVTGASGTASLEARINGTPVVSATGLTFAGLINQAAYGRIGNAGGQPGTLDDVVVWDNTGTENNDWMGDTFVIVAPTNSDGVANDWTASTGTARWDMIDELTPNDADFITGPTNGSTQECGTTTPTLPATGGVAAVAVQARALKTDTGSSAISVGVASGASSHSSGPSVNLGTGALVFSHISDRNPEGNIAWTQSTAQAARFRVARTA